MYELVEKRGPCSGSGALNSSAASVATGAQNRVNAVRTLAVHMSLQGRIGDLWGELLRTETARLMEMTRVLKVSEKRNVHRPPRLNRSAYQGKSGFRLLVSQF